MELQRALPDYERHGVAVFAVSYDPVEVLAAFAEKHGITYPLLADAGSRVIGALGLLNTQIHEHHAAFGIGRRESVYGAAFPGAFLLDAAGVVVEKRFPATYRERETGVALLEQGFGLPSGRHGPAAQAEGARVAARAYLDCPTYRTGQRLWLTVELTVAGGWHVYAAPVPRGFVPLAVEVAPVPGVVMGELRAPAPRRFAVAGLDERFQVYDGRLTLAHSLTFWEKAGDLELEVAVRFQTCSDRDCLPPETLTMRLPLMMQNHVDAPR